MNLSGTLRLSEDETMEAPGQSDREADPGPAAAPPRTTWGRELGLGVGAAAEGARVAAAVQHRAPCGRREGNRWAGGERD